MPSWSAGEAKWAGTVRAKRDTVSMLDGCLETKSRVKGGGGMKFRARARPAFSSAFPIYCVRARDTG